MGNGVSHRLGGLSDKKLYKVFKMYDVDNSKTVRVHPPVSRPDPTL
jgi:hypothetical protein